MITTHSSKQNHYTPLPTRWSVWQWDHVTEPASINGSLSPRFSTPSLQSWPKIRRSFQGAVTHGARTGSPAVWDGILPCFSLAIHQWSRQYIFRNYFRRKGTFNSQYNNVMGNMVFALFWANFILLKHLSQIVQTVFSQKIPNIKKWNFASTHKLKRSVCVLYFH